MVRHTVILRLVIYIFKVMEIITRSSLSLVITLMLHQHNDNFGASFARTKHVHHTGLAVSGYKNHVKQNVKHIVSF